MAFEVGLSFLMYVFHKFGNEQLTEEVTMSGPTAAQIDALLDFLDEHRDLARGNLRSIEGRTISRRLWDEIHTTLNAMGGCTKTMKQWQKVWTDKKHLAKKAASDARRSASATGGGPSTAPSLSHWELKIISIMGDGFADPQTSAGTQPFVEQPSQEETAASTHEPSNQDLPGPSLYLLNETQSQQQPSQQASATPARNASTTQSQLTSTRRRRGPRRLHESLRADSSVRDRLFRHDERCLNLEEQRNVELAGIREALVELCRHMQQQSRPNM